MGNYELTHHGVKGMKWGRRRYQNADGSLTAAGKKRYDRDISGLSNNKKKQYTADPDKWVKEDLERPKKVVDASSHMTGELDKINRSGSKPKKTRMDLLNMTDQQMRDRINRAMLEKQYNDMFAPQKVSRGKEIASGLLSAAGSALAVTSSALGIALAIKELRG